VPGRHQPDMVTDVRYVAAAATAARCYACSRALTRADMKNIFEVFLPQLLRYPNPSDPLNGEAAALLMRHPKEYEAKVKGACHATCARARRRVTRATQSTSSALRHSSRLRKRSGTRSTWTTTTMMKTRP
jgi:hypothetical protein